MNRWVFSAAGADNNDVTPNHFIFITKDTKLYVLVVILLAKNNQKLSKLLRKDCERLLY